MFGCEIIKNKIHNYYSCLWILKFLLLSYRVSVPEVVKLTSISAD